MSVFIPCRMISAPPLTGREVSDLLEGRTVVLPSLKEGDAFILEGEVMFCKFASGGKGRVRRMNPEERSHNLSTMEACR